MSKKHTQVLLKRSFSHEFKDAVKSLAITLESNSNTSYDPSTGIVTNTSDPFIGRGILRKYKSKYIDGIVVQSKDLKLTLIQSEWLNFKPEEGSTVIISDGSEYSVISFYEDSFNTHWSLQLRGV